MPQPEPIVSVPERASRVACGAPYGSREDFDCGLQATSRAVMELVVPDEVGN